MNPPADDARFTLQPIGVIRTPHRCQAGTPIQPFAAKDVAGEIEVFPPFRAALQDLLGFERVWILYWFHQAKPFSPRVIPYRDVVERGLFATRAPGRPNPIGLSAVRLLIVNVASGVLKVLDVDMLDGTPLLDIKPYVPKFDCYPDAKAGWLEASGADRDIADGRFNSVNSQEKNHEED
jgi:tRNA-Thr(GGU) m(6)t(6)A37 methyltransferase TsaA